jgi:hypothetical protein
MDGLDLRVTATVPGQVGERHAVVGQHRVQPVGEGGHDLAQEGGAVQLGVRLEEGDVGELAHPVDGQGHEQLALGQPQLADVDVDVADRRLGEAAPLSAKRPRLETFSSPLGRREMPCRTRQRWRALRVSLGMLLSRRQPRTSSSGRSVRRLNSTTTAPSASVRTVLRGRLGPIGASVTVVRPRHLATVLGFSPQRAARARVASCAACSSARTRGVVRAEP